MQARNSDRRLQHEYDFEVLMSSIRLIDPQSPWLPRFEGLLNVVTMAVNSQQKPDLTPVDHSALTDVFVFAIHLAANIDRPQLIGSLYDYVRLVLDDEGVATLVTNQINYDFSVVASFIDNNTALTDEVDRYRQMLIKNERLEPGEEFSAIFQRTMNFIASDVSHRDRFLSRLQGYFEMLAPLQVLVDDDGPTVYLTHTDDDNGPAGGLDVALIGP